jgi:hypothetical protein
MEHYFPYAFDYRLAPLWLAFGVLPQRDGVRVTPGGFEATFGLIRLRTERENVKGAHVTRDYRWWTAVGARMSFVDDGLTFGTNRNAGVCVHFHRPVPTLYRRSGHSALTVTVQDLDGLTATLEPSDA